MAIYTRTCAYRKCGETFQSVSVAAKYCCPSHRTLAWMENQKENYSPDKKSNNMDKNDFKKLLAETKEEEKVQDIVKKYPELIAQLERYEKHNAEMQAQIKELEAEQIEEHARWKTDPEKQAKRKLKYYNRNHIKKEVEEQEEPTEVIEQDEQYEVYRRQTLIGRILNSYADIHCEKIQCKKSDEIHRNQLLKDGFTLFDERKILRKN